jgi:DNA-binding NarL/FixJ family response regulator
MKQIRVLLIEDNRLLREGLAAMLAAQPDITLVASAGSAEAAVKRKALKPNIVLLDLGLRNKNSLRVVESLKRGLPSGKIIIMDLAPVQSDLFEYVKAGVAGFVLKDATFDDFLSTIRTVAQGGKVLPSPLAGSLFSQIIDHASRKRNRTPTNLVRLTKREREVMDLIAQGLSNKEIARRLYLATDTVKGHVHNILGKLALHTRLEVASFAHARETEESSRSSKGAA